MVHLSSATPAVCVVDDGESSAKETVVFWRRRSGDIGKKMRKPETGPSVFARFHIFIFCPDACLASAGACRSEFRWIEMFCSCPATLEFSTHRKRQKTPTCQAQQTSCRPLASFRPCHCKSSIFCGVVIARRSQNNNIIKSLRRPS